MVVRIRKFFNLIDLLKYGLALSALLIYLPLTAVTDWFGHDTVGNMFLELTPLGVFFATTALFGTVWSIMFTEGLIVNGGEMRRDKNQPAYRSMHDIQTGPSSHIPAWADPFFSVPVTLDQFLFFTILLGGPSLAVIVLHTEHAVVAAVAALLGFLVDYIILILICAPAALLDPTDLPLQGRFPLAVPIWSALGLGGTTSWVYRFSKRLQEIISWFVKLPDRWTAYMINQDTNSVFPIHLLAIVGAAVLFVLWVSFGVLAYPDRTFRIIEPPPVVYLFSTFSLFVWVFAGLSFHLERLHISPLLALLAAIIFGYVVHGVDHSYKVAYEKPAPEPLTPVDVVKSGKGGQNLVVVTSAGGGIWAAGWTTLALEKLIGVRSELAHEIRLLSTVSGGSTGAAYFVDALLNDPQFQGQGTLNASTLRDAQRKSVKSSLEAAVYGFAFLDFPRLLTGGLYNPSVDRGILLEDEWARIAAGNIDKNGNIERAIKEKEPCSFDREKFCFLELRDAIRKGSIPSIIFNSTAMEWGRRIMITPLDFETNQVQPGKEWGVTNPERPWPVRGHTLTKFLFPDGTIPIEFARADLNSIWSGARLSATFSFVSPAARADVKGDVKETEDSNAWKLHLVDGGYSDNYGVASALDWLRPVLEARLKGEKGLDFSRVLIINLRGWAEQKPIEIHSSSGYLAALVGPLSAIFAIRDGVARSRDAIDIDAFVTHWNRELKGKVELESVVFAPKHPNTKDEQAKQGPLSWYLTREDIQNLHSWWGKGEDPAGWQGNICESWRKVAAFLRSPKKAECQNP